MLPGKTFSPEEVLQILRKRVWLVLVPFAIVSAATAIVARKLPDVYRSEALIYVVPQRVPESFVRSTVTNPLQDRLMSIAQTILTRAQLERIILELNLYEKERRDGEIMEDIVNRMRNTDIQTRVERGDAFRIAYTGTDRRLVKEVADKLSNLFISENVRNRGNQAEGTSQFLESSLEDVRRNLQDQERKMAEFTRKYSGELPTQMDSNIQAQRSVEMQIQSLVESIDDDRDRRLNLEKLIADLEQGISDVPVSPEAGGTTTSSASTKAQRLAAARADLADLEKRYGPGFSDVRKAQALVKSLEDEVNAESQPGNPGDRPPMTATEIARRRTLDNYRAMLTQLERKIAENQKEEARLRGIVGAYQRRIEAAPSRGTELTELTRGYDTAKGMFESRYKNLEDAKLAASLETRAIGEQFTLLEQARAPERPFKPNRQAINVFGMIAGLGCGLVLVALLEYRDKSFKSDDEITRVLTLPVLAVVPFMQTAVEKRKAFQFQLLLGIGFGTVVAACLGVVVYTMVR
jgi:polysaccharide chain length determinant protein (PEP-CTERM system associated)